MIELLQDTSAAVPLLVTSTSLTSVSVALSGPLASWAFRWATWDSNPEPAD